MFTELNAILNHSPSKPPEGTFILLSDSQTEGTFLIHHFLSLFLKGGHKVCFISLSQSFSHYNAVGQKLGVNLHTAKETGQLVYVDGLKYSLELVNDSESESTNPLECIRDKTKNLKPLFDIISKSVCSEQGEVISPSLVLIDDVSILLSLGVSVKDVTDFLHYCVVLLCGNTKSVGCLVTLVHSDKDVEDEENDLLLKQLSYHSNLHLHVEGLSSGYCKDVHGQLTIEWTDPWQITTAKPHHKLYQYKILDKNVKFFAPGTSAAVL
ncbi:elongator complex protein 6-like [Glandiceps talaboti]